MEICRKKSYNNAVIDVETHLKWIVCFMNGGILLLGNRKVSRFF